MKRLKGLIFLAAVFLLPMLSTKAYAIDYTFSNTFNSDPNWFSVWTPDLLPGYVNVVQPANPLRFGSNDFSGTGGNILHIHPNHALRNDTLPSSVIDGTNLSYQHTAIAPDLSNNHGLGFPVNHDFYVTLDANSAQRIPFNTGGTNGMSFYSLTLNELVCDTGNALSPLSSDLTRDQITLEYSSWENGADFRWTLHVKGSNGILNPRSSFGGLFPNWSPIGRVGSILSNPRLAFKFHTETLPGGSVTITVSSRDADNAAAPWTVAWGPLTLTNMGGRWWALIFYPIITAKFGTNPPTTDFLSVENMSYTGGAFNWNGDVCLNTPCTPACSFNSQCDDMNPATTDTCSNAGTCSAVCAHDSGPCVPECATAADCDDSNAATTDTCNTSVACAVCAHTPSDSCCANPTTVDLTNTLEASTGIFNYTFANDVTCSKVHLTLKAPSAGTNPGHICVQVETAPNVWSSPVTSKTPADSLSGGRVKYTFELDAAANTTGAHRLRYSKPGVNGCL